MTGARQRRVVAVSPHLDDVAFSCGATLRVLAAVGWEARVVTCLTASVAKPTGFALACQTDKGIDAEADYMALRRAEDRKAMAVLGVDEVVHLPLAEAPHRGYDSAAALFTEVRADDALRGPLSALLAEHVRGATLLLAPQGCGGHVDHRLVLEAVVGLGLPTAYYRDTPYVLRDPHAPAAPELPAGLDEHPVDVAAHLPVKVAACQAYASQLGFQFGGAAAVGPALTTLAAAEGGRLGVPSAEVLRLPEALRELLSDCLRERRTA